MTTTTTSIHCDPTRRHDFTFLVDCTDGNPNGDPDSDNYPRIDIQTMQGLISDVCVKRKIRDAIEQMVGQEEGYRIFINADGVPLNTLLREGAIAVQGGKKTEAEELLSLEPVTVATGETEARAKRVSGKKKPNGDGLSAEKRREQADARSRYMCEQFYDIRAFGAVMSTGDYPAG